LAGQWLTARVTFAAAITKKLLMPIADFIPEADWASILMVNGELMAKPLGTRL
jgi:xanthine/uracil/vitamin C permease (AzgA family)